MNPRLSIWFRPPGVATPDAIPEASTPPSEVIQNLNLAFSWPVLLVIVVLTITTAAILPVASGLLVMLTILVAVATYFRRALPSFFAGLMTILLVGYAIGDRGFAYLGYPPIFIGELVLAVGLVAAVAAGSFSNIWATKATLSLLLFQAIGLIATVPYLRQYGLDSLRDAVLWGYGTFAIVIVCLASQNTIERAVRRFGAIAPIFLVAIPILLTIQRWAPQLIPIIPPGEMPLVLLKSGDVAVHLGGIAAFLLLGLHRGGSGSLSQPATEWFLWTCWLISFALISDSRGGMLSALVAVGTVFLLRVASRWRKPLILAIVAIVLGLGLQVEIDTGRERDASIADIFQRIQSTFMTTGVVTIDVTKQWRLQWWEDIIDYTVYGPYRWLGKGYGVNLADDDGYQVEADGSLRNPHSIHMTILARSGLVGLAAWSAFLLLIVLELFHRTRARCSRTSSLAIWFLAYLLSFIVNGSFDVYLEGPQGGIWFWTLIGATLVFLGRTRRASDQRPSTSSHTPRGVTHETATTI